MSPPVSIIIPCYNAEAWLAAAIESALAQEGADLDIIVVNDGSRDRSLEIARRYEARGVRIIDQANGGAAAARNAGLKAARGAYLQFLDADDLLAPDKIVRQLEQLGAGDPRAVAAGAWGRFHQTPADAQFLPEAVWRDRDPVDWLVCSWSGGGMMHPAAWLVPQAVAASAGPWDERLSLDDDGEYFSRVVLAAQGVRFAPAARSFYRAHDGPRLSASKGLRAAESSFLSCTLKERHLLAREDSARTRRAIGANYSRFAWEQLVAAPALSERAAQRWQELAPDVPIQRAGPWYNLAAALFGWRRARRWQLRRAAWREKLSP
jgi:glycosyltransferase involved in cell wall biosynthesis